MKTVPTIGDKPMGCAIALDWATYSCPCGSTLCTRYLSDYAVSGWLRIHKPHTNLTVLERTTEDGQRMFAVYQPDKVVPYYDLPGDAKE